MKSTTQPKANVPALRFPEFEGEWKLNKLSDIAFIYDGTHQTPKYTDDGVKFVSVENIGNLEGPTKFISEEAFKKDFKIKPQKGDILMTRITAGIIGATAIVQNDNPLGYYVSLALIREKVELDVSFLSTLINSIQFKRELHKRIIHVAFPKKINLGDIGECKATIPTLPEQQKIASFLTAVDEKLQALKKKKSLLEQYKKGVMQKLFSQELRFKDEHGNDFPEWEEKQLGEVLIKNSKKNKKQEYSLVQSVSNKHGFVNQDEYFEDRVIASKDLSNYYVIQKGNFAYNPSRIDVGSLAYKYDDNTSVISPLYISFSTDKKFLKDDFLLNWFFTELFTKQMKSSFEGSVRNTLSYEALSKITIEFPSLEEQTKIANFLSSLDAKINQCQQQLERTELYKKGLLQQMFV